MLAVAVTVAAAASSIGATAAYAGTGHGAKVVKEADRKPVGKMLVTLSGSSLYTHPSGPCTGGCLDVWPALVLPSGATVAKGAKCLSTTPAADGGLQVEYQDQPLYTFVDDHGKSLNGNGVNGFEAATIDTACP